MSATAWQDYRRIWTAATTWRDQRSMAWIGRVALFVALAGGMARLAGVLGRVKFWQLEAFVLVGWFGIVWMMYFLPASVLMNSAPNARLVPRQRRRLRQMAMASWLFMTLGATLAFLPVSHTLGAFPLFAVYMLGTMLVRAGIRPAVALVVLAITWPFSSEYLPAGLLHAMTGTRGQVVESIVLVLAALWSLGLLYPAGGDRHLDGREQVVAGLGTIDTRSTVNRPRVSWTNRFAYIPALERDCWLRKPEALLMHAMGPVAHWSAWIPAAALILLITLGLALLRDGRVFSHDFMDGLGIGLSSATVIAVFSSAQFAQQLGKTRGEQALLRLTPLAGNTALLNRRLADGMTKAGLITWSMMTAILLLLAWVGGADTVGLLRQFGLCCLGGQLAALYLLGDFARSLPSFSWRRPPVLLLQVGCNLAAAYGLAWLGGEFWAWLALVAVIGAVFLLVRSRRRMLAAAPAFPVERMG